MRNCDVKGGNFFLSLPPKLTDFAVGVGTIVKNPDCLSKGKKGEVPGFSLGGIRGCGPDSSGSGAG